MKKPSILISNDDGIYSDGIFALWEAMSKIGKTTVVAPNTEKSAVGHAITLSDPIRIQKVKRANGFEGFAVHGTPADSVKIAVKAIMDSKPDLIISGINAGANVNVCDRQGFTPLMIIVSNGGKNTEEMIIALTDAGANVNATSINGQTPLMWAVQHHDKYAFGIVELLINLGADINKQADDGSKAIDFTRLNSMVELILDNPIPNPGTGIGFS